MIDTKALERATLIANDVPGVRVSSVLTAGANPGQTDLVATVDSRPPVTGLVSGDNEDPRSTGAGKISLDLALADIAGIGDQAQLMADTSEGKHYADLAYSVPLGATGLRGALDASYMHYRLLDEFAASGGRGQAATAGVNLTYPLLRSQTRDVYLSGGYSHRHLINDADAGNLSDKKTDSFNVGINGDSNDAFGGGGAMVGALSFTNGKLNLGGDAADLEADAEGPRRDGRYAKVTGNIGRLQRLNQAGSLWVSVNGQFAGERLDSSEQFSLGGPSGVRAYPVLEASGDEGVIATIEYRYRASDALQFSAFYDFGHIDRERDPQPSTPSPNSYSLQGVGVGVEWNIAKRVALHAMTATRIGTNPGANANGSDGDGTKRCPQFWVLAEVPF
jgi:hemolysin activation/secretion protein